MFYLFTSSANDWLFYSSPSPRNYIVILLVVYALNLQLDTIDKNLVCLSQKTENTKTTLYRESLHVLLYNVLVTSSEYCFICTKRHQKY